MVERIKYLKNGGAEIISFTSVTMHILLDHIYKKTDIELESIPKAVCEKAVSKGTALSLLKKSVIARSQGSTV